MPRFLALEREHRSLIVGLRRTARREAVGASGARWSLFVTLAGGMEELVTALAARLPAGAVRLATPVAAVEPASGGWRVELQAGPPLQADGVVLAGPAPAMAPVVKAVDPSLAGLLQGIAYASSATIALGYRRSAIRHRLDGFGFVVPQVEHRGILACTFSSVKYPERAPEGFALLRVFVGGAMQADLLARRRPRPRPAGPRRTWPGSWGSQATPSCLACGDTPAPCRSTTSATSIAWRPSRPAWRASPGLALAGGAYRGSGSPTVCAPARPPPSA